MQYFLLPLEDYRVKIKYFLKDGFARADIKANIYVLYLYKCLCTHTYVSMYANIILELSAVFFLLNYEIYKVTSVTYIQCD